jgi:hypothetical protein
VLQFFITFTSFAQIAEGYRKEIMVCDCLREKIEPLLEGYFKVLGKRIDID